MPPTIHRDSSLRIAASLSTHADPDAAVHELVGVLKEKLGSVSIDLACLFFSGPHIKKAGQLAAETNRLLNPRYLVGCSGEGIIAGPEELEAVPGVTLWVASLPAVTIEPLHLSFSSTQDQFRIHCAPPSDSIGGSFLLFADPFTMPMQEALKFLDGQFPGEPAVGGLAGGGHESGENRLILQGETYAQGLVGIRMSGPVGIRPVISQGCRIVGERFVVTRAEHNIIHELGGIPALQRLQTVFEHLSASERRQAHRTLHIGIAIDEHRARFGSGDYLVRNLVGADQTTGAIAIGDTIQEGQTVQFHLRDAQSASHELQSLLAADRASHDRRPLGALMFSCCGRGEGLFGRRHHDTAAMMEQYGDIPVAGIFAQGEIGPVGGKNFLHSYTASMAIFEGPETPTQSR